VELAVQVAAERGTGLTHVVAVIFLAISMYFVWRSFYRMRIGEN
jgi:K(+)-stimulated pyrophosphate-energized sodium pump